VRACGGRRRAGRGYKVIHVYRTECKDSKPVELRIASKEAKATCMSGGADCLMHAETPRRVETGKGEYGPFKAMLFGRLKFEGPKMEATANMDPFESFLRLVGKVPSDAGSCPQ
jgi:putative sterol carrier protein